MLQPSHLEPLSQDARQDSGRNGKQRCEGNAQKDETEKYCRLQHGERHSYGDHPSQQMPCYRAKDGPSGIWRVDGWHAFTENSKLRFRVTKDEESGRLSGVWTRESHGCLLERLSGDAADCS